MDDEEFTRWRQKRIEEIRRTGKTWQWPDTVQHPKWTREHIGVLIWAAFSVAIIIIAVIVSWLPAEHHTQQGRTDDNS